MLGPLGTAFRDGERQSGATPPMIQEHTLPTVLHALPPVLAMVEDHLSPLQLERVTAVGNRMLVGAKVRSETDQEVEMDERPVEASGYARSAVSL